jgi:hypothetical protein
MREISHEITIDAPVEVVWQVLTDFPAHSTWNPFLTFDQGATTIGDSLKVKITPPGARASTFTPTLTAYEPFQRYGWNGRVMVPGIFDGHHEFVLEQVAPRRTILRQQESFSGVLVPLLGGILTKTHQGFAQMNTALKERAERISG